MFGRGPAQAQMTYPSETAAFRGGAGCIGYGALAAEHGCSIEQTVLAVALAAFG